MQDGTQPFSSKAWRTKPNDEHPWRYLSFLQDHGRVRVRVRRTQTSVMMSINPLVVGGRREWRSQGDKRPRKASGQIIYELAGRYHPILTINCMYINCEYASKNV